MYDAQNGWLHNTILKRLMSHNVIHTYGRLRSSSKLIKNNQGYKNNDMIENIKVRSPNKVLKQIFKKLLLR